SGHPAQTDPHGDITMQPVMNPVAQDLHDGVLTLTLNRPEQYNALSEEVLLAMQHALDAASHDESLRCVVINASGRAFCAGHDLQEEHGKRDHDYYLQLFRQCGRVMQSIVHLPVPVIAKVQGAATAAGCQLVASCDLAVA